MTPEELAKMTLEERARLEAAEQKALRILKNRINEGPRPQRHRRLFLVILAVALGLSIVLWIVDWIVSLVR